MQNAQSATCLIYFCCLFFKEVLPPKAKFQKGVNNLPLNPDHAAPSLYKENCVYMNTKSPFISEQSCFNGFLLDWFH